MGRFGDRGFGFREFFLVLHHRHQIPPFLLNFPLPRHRFCKWIDKEQGWCVCSCGLISYQVLLRVWCRMKIETKSKRMQCISYHIIIPYALTDLVYKARLHNLSSFLPDLTPKLSASKENSPLPLSLFPRACQLKKNNGHPPSPTT